MVETLLNFSSIILADIVLSGDNALIIGMAAASLSPELRKKAILFGMIMAAVLRIIFAIFATYLLAIKGLLFIGGLLLLWVSWRLFNDIREDMAKRATEAQEDIEDGGYQGPPRRTLLSALISITVADVSMSIDNVLAVAAIARDNITLLVFGLALAILLMAFAAAMIVKLMTRFPWISWLGLVVLLYVSGRMLWEGWPEVAVLAGLA
ncbi:MAG: YjbE family putative metal transport protein [Alphaproteobacteria bacterium]|nr:YjbE family putative metal transport protein [Alphaproteobacteria bacterium]